MPRKLSELHNNQLLAAHHLARARTHTRRAERAVAAVVRRLDGLIHRMQRAGHMTREAHPHDGRSWVVRLAPDLHARGNRASAPFGAEIDSLIVELPRSEADTALQFLERVAEAAERHADRLASEADATARDALAVPLPGLWANLNTLELTLPRGRARALASGRMRARVGSPGGLPLLDEA
jgi:DNA-binding MarR family transcriptional regulator